MLWWAELDKEGEVGYDVNMQIGNGLGLLIGILVILMILYLVGIHVNVG